MQQTGQTGASILEFMAGLAIAGLLCFQGGLVFQEIRQAFGLRVFAQQLEDSIRLQAKRALLLEQDLLLRIASPTIALCQEPRGECTPANCSQPLLDIPPGIAITAAAFRQSAAKKSCVSLYRDGSASPGTVTLQSDFGQICRVVQALRGRTTRVCGGEA